MCGILPGLEDFPSQLEELEISINGAKMTLEDLIFEQNEMEYNLAVQYKSKLMELLNKY